MPNHQRLLIFGALALFWLGVILGALKLLGFIALPWWVVLLPFAPTVLVVAAIILAMLAWMARGAH